MATHTTADRGATGWTGERLDWTAIVVSGLLAGLVFMMAEMILVPLALGGSAWGPPRMIAAIVMGEGVLPPPATFEVGVFLVALLVHFTLSVIYAFLLDLIIRRMGAGASLAVGAVFGIALYVVNFYGFTAVFPWFAMARNWVSALSHVIFGLVVAGTYVALRRRHARHEAHTTPAVARA